MRLQKRPISVTKETYSCYKRDKVTLIVEVALIEELGFFPHRGVGTSTFPRTFFCKRALQK